MKETIKIHIEFLELSIVTLNANIDNEENEKTKAYWNGIVSARIQEIEFLKDLLDEE